MLRGAYLNFATGFRTVVTSTLLLALPFLAVSSSRAQETAAAPKDPYQKWLREDVRWIITDEERASFKRLSTDKQRDDFVVAFWERRNPIPASPENAFKEEHYRRLAYTNQHFAEGMIPGWKTDRGRFYIMYGPPDNVVRHLPSASPQPGGIQTNDFPSEEWRWGYVEGIGRDVTLKFVDSCACGEYKLTRGDK